MKDLSGILLIDKPVGVTSRFICDKIQKRFHMKKVGHLGTLDPFASGLLLIAVGKACKILKYLENLNKTYCACLKLGETTPTLDTESEIILKKDVPLLNKDKILDVLNSFKGEIVQKVPLTSAKRVGGKRLYEYAHNNEKIDTPTQKVNIYDIYLLDFNVDNIIFKVEVSKGTYIRTLGKDIANRLNTIGYLTSLRREAIGEFNVVKSVSIEDVSEKDLIDIKDALYFIKKYKVDDNLIKKVRNGVSLKLKDIEDELILIIDRENNPIAIYQKQNDEYRCSRGLW